MVKLVRVGQPLHNLQNKSGQFIAIWGFSITIGRFMIAFMLVTQVYIELFIGFCLKHCEIFIKGYKYRNN